MRFRKNEVDRFQKIQNQLTLLVVGCFSHKTFCHLHLCGTVSTFNYQTSKKILLLADFLDSPRSRPSTWFRFSAENIFMKLKNKNAVNFVINYSRITTLKGKKRGRMKLCLRRN